MPGCEDLLATAFARVERAVPEPRLEGVDRRARAGRERQCLIGDAPVYNLED
jgi:hypothetical protein